jgi:hypothetical protein
MKKLTKTGKNLIGGGLAVVVGLALLKRTVGDKVAATAVANANAQVEAQAAIDDAVATATAPPPSVAGLDGLGFEARQSIMRSSAYRNQLAGHQQRQKRARRMLAGLGVVPAVARAAVPPAPPHHLPGRVFQKDMHSPWKRTMYDSPLNYPNLEGNTYQPSLPGGQPGGALPGMGMIGRLGASISNMLAGSPSGALPGMGDDPAVPGVDQALNSMATTINASIGLVSGAVIIGLAYWGMKK